MFVITDRTNDNVTRSALALVSNYSLDPDSAGVWLWFGFWPDGSAAPLTVGTVLVDWLVYGKDSESEERTRRTDMLCEKVNTVTARFRCLDDDSTYTLRIDR